jgi:peptidylprolyl isomerase
MKKFFTVIMVFSLLTSLFASFTSKAQDSAATPAATTTTTAAPAAPATPAAATTADKTDTTAPAKATEPAAANDAAAPAPKADATADDQKVANPLDNILLMDLKDGQVVIQLLPEVAPNTVKRIKELTRQGFYDGVPFHRVIEGFMAQTGDPTGTGTGGSGQKLDAEFNSTKHVRGTVSMARAADPNSADSQFFIMFGDAPHLDGNYTAFGKVIEGMEYVDKIKKGTGPNGMVSDPDKLIKMRVASDVKDVSIPGVNAPAAAAGSDAAAPAATDTTAAPAATDENKTEPAKQ